MAKGGTELGIQAQVSTIEEYCSTQQFDNIISIEVIEHVEFDKDAVQKLHSLLKVGGSLVITVPASPFLFSEADRVSGHYRRYSLDKFTELLTAAAFRKLSLRRYGFPLLFIYALARKAFLDRILINHFTFTHHRMERSPILISRIYPFIFSIDRLNIPFWSVGYVATYRK
jgi:SAM-dependent methyltransferase